MIAKAEAPAWAHDEDRATAVNGTPLLYTAEQAAERLGTDEHGRPIKSARWLLDMARAGRIPYTRVGKTLCFSERNLRDLVEGGQVAAPNAARATKKSRDGAAA
jgi:hypothetical protein